MALIGMKYPVVAKYSDSTGTAAYTEGTVMAKAMKADIKWTKNDEKLYADDAIDDIDNSISGGTLTLGTNDLPYEVQALVLGHKLNTEKNELTVNENDVAPFTGVGFYAKTRKNKVQKFRAFWFPKVSFSEPDETVETKGDKTTFGTPTIEGTIAKDLSGNLKVETIVATEEEAITWLKTKASIATE